MCNIDTDLLLLQLVSECFHSVQEHPAFHAVRVPHRRGDVQWRPATHSPRSVRPHRPRKHPRWGDEQVVEGG